MGWFKKALAKVGVGSAEIELVLPKASFAQGESTSATVLVTGGSTRQQIDTLSFELCCDYMGWEQIRSNGEQGQKRRKRRMTHTLVKWHLPDTFALETGEKRQFDTQFQIPMDTPLSMGDGKIWVRGSLDIPMAKDASCEALVTVTPDALLNAVFEGFEQSGLRIEMVSNQDVERASLPFEQCFTLVPVSGRLMESLRRVELVASRDNEGLQLALVLSRQSGGVGDALGRLVGANKVRRALTIPHDALPTQTTKHIEAFLSKIE
ncbi:sporulation protein [Enterovibrio sp. 27052020O]|uniref:sporulation protein n=1 Tax=Enterovibrio sp. 27052020O TaxID=3241166 RepID=UPI00388EE85A